MELSLEEMSPGCLERSTPTMKLTQMDLNGPKTLSSEELSLEPIIWLTESLETAQLLDASPLNSMTSELAMELTKTLSLLPLIMSTKSFNGLDLPSPAKMLTL